MWADVSLTMSGVAVLAPPSGSGMEKRFSPLNKLMFGSFCNARLVLDLARQLEQHVIVGQMSVHTPSHWFKESSF